MASSLRINGTLYIALGLYHVPISPSLGSFYVSNNLSPALP